MVQIFTLNSVFELQTNETLLEGLERTGHEVEYQCRAGYCGACRIKIRSGQVHYSETPIAFVQHDEILPCCCTALTPIQIDCIKPLTELQIQGDLFFTDLFSDEV